MAVLAEQFELIAASAAVLGGAYEPSNLAINSVQELVAFAGDAAKQITDLPDGTPIKLVVTP